MTIIIPKINNNHHYKNKPMAIVIQNNNHKTLWDYNNREMISIILYRQKGMNGMFSTAISCYEDF